MQHRLSMPRVFVLLLIVMLALVACERPLRDEPALPTTTILTPVVQPTLAVPGLTPEATPGVPVATVDPLLPTPEGGVVPTVDPLLPTPADGGVATVAATVPAGNATAIPPTGEQQYTVADGDTLGEIAQAFGVTAEEIAARNNMATVDDLIYVGQVLVIPVAGTVATVPAGSATTTAGGERIHIVQPGENLYRIALLYGLNFQELATYNNLADPDSIEVGQAIRIPPSQ